MHPDYYANEANRDLAFQRWARSHGLSDNIRCIAETCQNERHRRQLAVLISSGIPETEAQQMLEAVIAAGRSVHTEIEAHEHELGVDK